MRDEFTNADLKTIESRTQAIARELFSESLRRRPGILHRSWWDDWIMARTLADPAVKTRLFHFIDVLPTLTTDEAILERLVSYLAPVQSRLPRPAGFGLSAASEHAWLGAVTAKFAKRFALAHARRFIAGVTIDEVLQTAQQERRANRAFTLDVLGEAVISEAEADRYQQSYLDLIHTATPVVNGWKENPQIDRDDRGPIPRMNVSLKLSGLDSQFDPIDPEESFTRVAARLRPILCAARKHRAYVHIDMESHAAKQLTLDIFQRLFLEDEFRDTQDTGIVIQAYLRDSERDLVSLRDWAKQRGTPVTVRLVKGAYWDYETVHALNVGWPVPVFQAKWQSDEQFERLTRFMLLNRDFLRPAFGSHNLRSLAHAIALQEFMGLPREAIELQMLYGMADVEKDALVDRGARLRVYMPFGELIPGMAYLVRRLLENSSNDSFLKASFSSHAPPEELLMNPTKIGARAPRANAKPSKTPAFQNEPPYDFSLAARREEFQRALDEVRSQLGRDYPAVINGKAVSSSALIESINPSRKNEIVGRVASATAAQAREAVEAAKRALPAWSALSALQRADYLRRAASVMRLRRAILAAWEVYECGKPWREADGDICEAIDFCEYYAQQALALASLTGADAPGETNRFTSIPRGVAAIIAPWNFPLAILTGMTSAALVTGNTVVFKPAEQSSVIGAKLTEIFQEIGLPPGVANFLPGTGEVVGAALVEHPDVALVAFTGSRGVGLAINRRAAEISAESRAGVKHVIAEMGGKNAIIIDDDADLDEAVSGVVKSAFGYSGQKCSACSRVIVLDAVHDAFLTRLVEATRALRVGPASDPGVTIGPVIDQEAFDRIHRYIEIGKLEANLALAVDVGALANEGYFISPHIFTNVAPSARIAREEIFGPVLAVFRARDLTEAIAILHDSDYALTAGLFSRNPESIERATREIMVGNLYINRPITGALVGRQPFGGFKMSGMGAKAGGPDYLPQFVQWRTITENTLRRGFAPEEETAGE